MKQLKLVLLLIFVFTCLNKISAQGTWSNLGAGIPINGIGVLALCADTINNVLYAGGEFDSVGSIQQNSLAKWDGTKWDTTVAIDSGVWVYALIMYKGNLIVAFSNGVIGEYDGSTLKYLPSFDAAAYCFYIYNDTLYAGGEFYQSGNTVLNCIAKWSGTKWLPVDKGFSWYDCCVEVSAMTEYDGDLIAAGTFDSAGNINGSSIAAYNGSNWTSLGVNLNTYGKTSYNGALGVYKNKLYVAGDFDSINSVYTPSGIASWNGTNWDTTLNNTYSGTQSLPSNISMASFDGYLFVSGGYNNQSPFKYDGNIVSMVDSGVYAGVGIRTMTSMRGSLYVGGEFLWAVEADPHTPCVARWTPDSTTTEVKPIFLTKEQLTVYPNPASNQLTLISNQLPIEQLQIEDVLGQTIIEQNFGTSLQKQTVDVSALPQGIYFYRLTGSNFQVVTGKFVKE